jgi:uncharacterized protein (DUF885 family)
MAFLKQTTSQRQEQLAELEVCLSDKKTVCHLCKQWTTTAMTPAHDLGLSEVARLTAEMEKVKKQVGFEGTLLSSSSM